jgi:broad specificity phosphatase PhoE/CTP:molybdopterin cytidylyltransferase MocA
MKETPRIVALILAAGSSSRLEMFKPLAPLGGSTLIEEAVARFRAAGISDVRVVVGHRADGLIPVLERLNVQWVFNAEYQRGMFSSVMAGVASFEPGVEAFFLLPCDVALVRPRTIRHLLEVYDRTNPKVVHPRFDGKRGHPPLVPASWLKGELPPDIPGGLQTVLERHEPAAVDVEVVDEGVLLDCDTPEDYRVLVGRRSMEGSPSERECEAIWEKLRVPEPIRAHCSMVAEVARLLAAHLIQAGLPLNLPLVVAAGRLHDIARRQRDHARAGAALLADLGYPCVGDVVKRHMDIEPGRASLSEAEVIYFADKCVEEDRLASMEERFRKSLNRCVDRPDIRHKIMKRWEDARAIEKRMQAILGLSPEAVIRRYKRSIRATAGVGPRTIYLARHGAIPSADTSKRFIGQLDVPLSREGRLQAERLRDVLSGMPLSAVYCSDLRRSTDTAEIIAAPHGLTCISSSRLREIALGEWEGLSHERIRRDFPAEFRERGLDIVHYRPPGGESFLDCACRVLAAFFEIIHTTRGDILVVGHAGANRVILCQVMGASMADLFGIKQGYGCLNVVQGKGRTLEVKLLDAANGDLSNRALT